LMLVLRFMSYVLLFISDMEVLRFVSATDVLLQGTCLVSSLVSSLMFSDQFHVWIICSPDVLRMFSGNAMYVCSPVTPCNGKDVLRFRFRTVIDVLVMVQIGPLCTPDNVCRGWHYNVLDLPVLFCNRIESPNELQRRRIKRAEIAITSLSVVVLLSNKFDFLLFMSGMNVLRFMSVSCPVHVCMDILRMDILRFHVWYECSPVTFMSGFMSGFMSVSCLIWIFYGFMSGSCSFSCSCMFHVWYGFSTISISCQVQVCYGCLPENFMSVSCLVRLMSGMNVLSSYLFKTDSYRFKSDMDIHPFMSGSCLIHVWCMSHKVHVWIMSGMGVVRFMSGIYVLLFMSDVLFFMSDFESGMNFLRYYPVKFMSDILRHGSCIVRHGRSQAWTFSGKVHVRHGRSQVHVRHGRSQVRFMSGSYLIHIWYGCSQVCVIYGCTPIRLRSVQTFLRVFYERADLGVLHYGST
ncbi:hypothetical protein L9F63_019396, partial [Diploptera punctata]